MESAQRKFDVRGLASSLLTYLAGGGSSEPSSRHKNIPPGPLGRGPREPKNSRPRGLERPVPGTSSSSTATQGEKRNMAKKLCHYKAINKPFSQLSKGKKITGVRNM